jgi:toxin-antitoxin system PIN domain toxin
MISPDVNILIYAFRPYDDMTEHCREWLNERVQGDDLYGLSELVLSGFIRIVTNPRWFPNPEPTATALEFAEWLLGQPNCVVLRPRERFWSIFSRLCRVPGVRANLVPDAYHAALAIETNSSWISFDGNFGRFPGLDWRRPF